MGVLHLKEARNRNENLIAFRIPRELSVTLRKMGVDPKEACLRALLEIAERNSLNPPLRVRTSRTGLILSPFSEKRGDLLVARERFELSSAGPKPAMLVRYTTGLHLILISLN